MANLIYSTSDSQKVSVVLPTRNRASSLETTIESVLNQSCPAFELVVVDDDSDDSTGEIVRRFLSPQVRYLKLSEHKGAAAARNIGIQESLGKLIAFQDSDDQWDRSKLALQVKAFERASPEVGVVYSSFHWKREKRNGITPSIGRTLLSITNIPHYRLGGNIRQALLRGNFISTQTAMVRKECFIECGGFDEKLPRLQDWDLWLRLAGGYEFKFINQPLVHTTLSKDSISVDDEALISAFQLLLDKYEGDKKAYKELSAQYHYALGDINIQWGMMDQGKAHLHKAIGRAVWNSRYWFAALAAHLGPAIYSRSRKLLGPGYSVIGEKSLDKVTDISPPKP